MFNNGAKKDILVIGRVGVDLYAKTPNTDFADCDTFVKQIGGSAGNMAVGLNRSGCKVGFIGKVASDMLGDFVYDYMCNQGINTDGLTRTQGLEKTPLAICETKAKNCGAVLYRNNASDIHITKQDISSKHIALYKGMIITGTGLSADPSQGASFYALKQATEYGVTTVLDLDYRAEAWQSVSHTTQILKSACSRVDIIIGNVQEFEVLCGTDYTPTDKIRIPNGWQISGDIFKYIQSLVRQQKTVILKNGHLGCMVFTLHMPPIFCGAYTVDTLKPYGAGDAFASICIAHILQNPNDWQTAVIRGSAAAALVVMRMGCAFAMPSPAQINDFIANSHMDYPPMYV